MKRFSIVLLILGACSVQEASAVIRYVKASGTGGAPCNSWANACNLANGLAAADASSSDQVWVQAGTYGPIELKNGVKVIGGFAGTESLITQSNPAVNVTLIDGAEGGPCATNMNITLSDLPAMLRGFTLRNGRDGGTDEGGAIYLENSNAQIVDCILEDNSATHVGGAVTIRGTGSPQFVNCVFRRNGKSSTNPLDTKGGGAVFLRNGTPQFVNCLFDDNRAGQGGAVIIADGFVTFVNCTFVRNKSTDGAGGAIYDPEGRATLKNCILWSNKRVVFDAATQQEVEYPDQIRSGSGGTSLALFSNVEGNWVGSNNVSIDPLFVNAAQGNFQLGLDSPCKNTGDTNAVAADTVDLDWDSQINEPNPKDLGKLPRIRLGAVDMGAYEIFSDTPPGGGGDP